VGFGYPVGSVDKRGGFRPLSKVSSPSPSQGEGDKGGEVNKVDKLAEIG